MPRIRTIKPSFFTSMTIADLPLEARLTFIGMWTYVDDEGRGVDDPRLLKSAIWPLDDRRNTTAIGKDLDALVKAKLVERYSVGGRRYLRVVGWKEHQKINRPQPSSLPPSPAETSQGTQVPITEPSRNDHGTISDQSVNDHGTISDRSLGEGKGREGKGKERKGSLSSSPLSPHGGRGEPAGSAGEEDEDDQDDQKNPSPAVPAGEVGEAEAVWAKLAEVDLERFLADGGVVRWRASWLRTAAANRARDHGDDVEVWRAEGVDWPDIVARLTALTQADPAEDRGRVIPSAAETRARIDAADAEAAETARLDALVDALPEVERVSLEAAACEWATANWAGGEAPPAMVRSKMRALVAANGTARGAP